MGGVGREAIERANAGTGALRELQRHEHRPDRTSMDPQSPSFSVSAAPSASTHARSPPSTDINSVSTDQAQARVPVDDGLGTGAVEVLGRAVSVDAASFMLPRVEEHSPDEAMMRAQARVASSPAPTSTPPVAVKVFASISEFPQWMGYAEAEPRPESALEQVESPSNLEEALRSEAYGWPRLVFPPLKKSGHIIIDACTRQGLWPVLFPTAFLYQIALFFLAESHKLIFVCLHRKNNATYDSKIAG